MNFKTTYVLFGVLLAVLVVFLMTQLLGKKTDGSAAYVFPSLHDKADPIQAKEIATVEIKINQPQEETLVLVRSGNGWRLQQPNARADGSAISQSINQIIGAKLSERAETPSTPQQAGLEPPRAVLTLKDKDGDRSWALNVGSSTIGDVDAMVYVASSDRPGEVLAVRRAELGSLFKARDEKQSGDLALKGLNDYRSRDLLAQHALDIQYVGLQDGKQGPVILKKEGTENRWVFEKPPFGEADYQGDLIGLGRDGSQQSGVQGLLSSLTNLRVESPQDFVADNVTDLAKYGLDAGNPERLRIEVKTQNLLGSDGEKKEPATSVLLIGKKADDKEDNFYAALDEGDKQPRSVVKVSGKVRDQVVKVLQNPSPLRSRDLVNLDPSRIDQVDWIEVDSGRETFQLHRTGAGSWDLIDRSGKVQKADGNVVLRLIDVIKDKRQIKDYPEDSKTDAELSLDRPSAVVSFWMEDPKEPAKKEEAKKEPDKKESEKKENAKAPEKEEKTPMKPTGPPTVRLVFGKKDKDLVYVLRELGKERVRAAVSDMILTKVSQEKLAYLDRKLPTFPPDQVVKLTLVRDGQTYEIDREEKDGKPAWRFKLPPALTGRTAEEAKVVRILDDLARMSADRLVGESATESELERYGLKPPAIKATVTVKKDDQKTEDRVYEFGKETDDKSGQLHARMNERDWVYLIGPHVLAPLKDELADTTVFTFDPRKVKEVKMAGWKNITGSPWKFDLERKSSGSWAVKAPEGFKLDDSRVERLVDSMSKLRAVKFVAYKTGGKPEHKLKVDDDALEIQLVVEGEKEPYVLTVGALSPADKGFFAASSNLPGDIFVLPEGMFAEILKRPAYFAAGTAASK